DKAITSVQKKGVSRSKARYKHTQKTKGKRRGLGSRKGSFNARADKKKEWMNKIRLQRNFIKELIDKGLITQKTYQSLYSKTRGGFFRSKRHIKLYLEEHHLIKEKNK
ncbi:50S ribosomal protein L19e, partial [Candidatus Woesearchaeota archaeon]|nr:50S ribosomal protein L19e [Candidatus Woesearchaeota archaeon]